jgi:DNA-binding CsgD family transcriptional regulator
MSEDGNDVGGAFCVIEDRRWQADPADAGDFLTSCLWRTAHMNANRSQAASVDFPKAPLVEDRCGEVRPCLVSGAINALVTGYGQSHGLSRRETSVLVLGVSGLHRKEAAYQLGCSPGTVDTYWRRILRKTSARSQAEVFAELLLIAVGNSLNC